MITVFFVNLNNEIFLYSLSVSCHSARIDATNVFYAMREKQNQDEENTEYTYMCTNKQTSPRFIMRSLPCSTYINKDKVKPVRETILHRHSSLDCREDVSSNTIRFITSSSAPIAVFSMCPSFSCKQYYPMIEINGQNSWIFSKDDSQQKVRNVSGVEGEGDDPDFSREDRNEFEREDVQLDCRLCAKISKHQSD